MPAVADAAQVDGREVEAPVVQLRGYSPARRWAMVTKEAKDQVRSYAESGLPGRVLLNCSEREPLAGVYCCATATKESA